MTYKYLGDRLTAPELRGALCEAVRDGRGKCVRGRNGNMMVRFLHEPEPRIVIGRLLRKQTIYPHPPTPAQREHEQQTARILRAWIARRSDGASDEAADRARHEGRETLNTTR